MSNSIPVAQLPQKVREIQERLYRLGSLQELQHAALSYECAGGKPVSPHGYYDAIALQQKLLAEVLELLEDLHPSV